MRGARRGVCVGRDYELERGASTGFRAASCKRGLWVQSAALHRERKLERRGAQTASPHRRPAEPSAPPHPSSAAAPSYAPILVVEPPAAEPSAAAAPPPPLRRRRSSSSPRTPQVPPLPERRRIVERLHPLPLAGPRSPKQRIDGPPSGRARPEPGTPRRTAVVVRRRGRRLGRGRGRVRRGRAAVRGPTAAAAAATWRTAAGPAAEGAPAGWRRAGGEEAARELGEEREGEVGRQGGEDEVEGGCGRARGESVQRTSASGERREGEGRTVEERAGRAREVPPQARRERLLVPRAVPAANAVRIVVLERGRGPDELVLERARAAQDVVVAGRVPPLATDLDGAEAHAAREVGVALPLEAAEPGRADGDALDDGGLVGGAGGAAAGQLRDGRGAARGGETVVVEGEGREGGDCVPACERGQLEEGRAGKGGEEEEEREGDARGTR